MSKFAFLAEIILRNILRTVYRNESKTISIYKVNKCNRNHLSLASYGVLIYISTLGDHFRVLSPSRPRNENSRPLKNPENPPSRRRRLERRIDKSPRTNVGYLKSCFPSEDVITDFRYPSMISVRIRWLAQRVEISIPGRSRDPASRPRFGENL